MEEFTPAVTTLFGEINYPMPPLKLEKAILKIFGMDQRSLITAQAISQKGEEVMKFVLNAPGLVPLLNFKLAICLYSFLNRVVKKYFNF